MKILITNDDGIFAPGIAAIAEWAKAIGQVTVVAPKVEQSGKSHSIDFINPVEVKRVELIDGVEAYSMDSTPADCVRFGICGLNRTYDLVLSGINKGVNLGADLVYSGTIGAIFEAGRLGHKALAFSTYPDSLDSAKKYLSEAYEYVMNGKLLELNPIYNINIPKEPIGIKITKQGSPYFSDEFEYKGNDMYLQTGEKIPDRNPTDMTLDTVATEAGYITVTPLLITRTNMEIFNKLTK